jgi:hypothetical protein
LANRVVKGVGNIVLFNAVLGNVQDVALFVIVKISDD